MSLRKVLMDHRGVVRRADLRAAGLTRADIDAALAIGDLKRIARDVYIGWSVNSGVKAAVLASGFLSHESAAAAWGLDVLTPPTKPHILVPHDRRAPEGCHVHWVRRQELADVITTEPFGPLTTLARTLADCARTLPFRDALVIVDSALGRQRISLHELHVLATSLRGPGAKRARKVLLAGDGRSDSVGETLVRAAALEAGAPRPELQYRIDLSSPDSSGIAVADLAWPTYDDREVKVVVEHDGFDAHGVRRESFDRDRERWNALQDEGWTLRIFTYFHATKRYARTGERIIQTLKKRCRETARSP